MRRTKWGLTAAVVACMVGFGGTARAGAVNSLSLTDLFATTGDHLQQGDVSWDITAVCTATNCGSLSATLGGNGIVIGGSGSASISSIISGGDFSVTFEEFTTASGFTAAAFSSIGGSGSGTAQIFDNSNNNYINNNDPTLSTIGNSASGSPSAITFSANTDILYGVDTTNAVGLQSVTIGQPVPEPASIGLLGVGLLGLAAVSRRSRRLPSAL